MDQQRKNGLTAGADGIIEAATPSSRPCGPGETIDKIYLQKGETDRTLGHIASTARAAGVVVVEADKRKLDAMSRTHAHQGSSPWRRCGSTSAWRASSPPRRRGGRRR
jgi:23S rRNA (guanosine2251-2'-O)-methyltransferase